MKITIPVFFTLCVTFTVSGCNAQKNMAGQMDRSRTNDGWLRYVDSAGYGYEGQGSYGGISLALFFKKVKWNNETKYVEVEGVAGNLDASGDTITACCGKFFIAKPDGGVLTNIRNIGATNNRYTGDTTNPNGYFHFNVEVQKGDRIYFCSYERTALREYNVSKMVYK